MTEESFLSARTNGGINELSLKLRKRLRSQTRCTPWRDVWELERVGQALTMHAIRLLDEMTTKTKNPHGDEHGENEEFKNSISRVALWKSRSEQGRIQHSIETTATLAEIAWRDYESQRKGIEYTTSRSTMELRLAYSAALIRGINGVADAMQQNRVVSVASVCDTVGIPGWLVDMRHDAAHNDLPTLSALRLACRTFLGFLHARYWQPMSTARCNLRQDAIQLLNKYKALSKSNNPTSNKTVQECNLTQQHANSDSSDQNGSSDENAWDNPFWGRRVGTNENRFAALSATSDRKSPLSKKPKSTKGKTSAAKNDVVSPLYHARQFVKTIPVDVGFQVALAFLVWGGGVGDSQPDRGILIPGAAAAYPENQNGVDKIRQRYKPLILVLCGAWPGFAPALLVHLVDGILSTEISHASDSERKLFFLVSWVRFLLSREFHMQNDPMVAPLPDKSSSSADLSKKPESSWTESERSFVQSSAPLETLKRANFPLNSLCDRCCQQLDASNKQPSSQSASSSSELVGMFSKILGNERIADMGLDGRLVSHDPSPTWKNSGEQEPKLSEQLGMGTARNASQSMSLAEMEALLSDSDVEEADETKPPNDKSNGDIVPLDLQLATSKVLKTTTSGSPWVQCDTWDACAIGSLPGYTV